MPGSGGIVRGLVALFGVFAIFGGLAVAGTGGSGAVGGVWLVVVGLVLIVVAILERVRYRSEIAERAGLAVGPGGGEPTSERLETRFGRTAEVFVDPTSERRMRVWLDSETGERRYRAED